MYQLQSVDIVAFDILHDGSVRHPVSHGDELPYLRILPSPNKVQDVRVG